MGNSINNKKQCDLEVTFTSCPYYTWDDMVERKKHFVEYYHNPSLVPYLGPGPAVVNPVGPAVVHPPVPKKPCWYGENCYSLTNEGKWNYGHPNETVMQHMKKYSHLGGAANPGPAVVNPPVPKIPCKWKEKCMSIVFGEKTWNWNAEHEHKQETFMQHMAKYSHPGGAAVIPPGGAAVPDVLVVVPPNPVLPLCGHLPTELIKNTTTTWGNFASAFKLKFLLGPNADMHTKWNHVVDQPLIDKTLNQLIASKKNTY